MIAMLCIKIFYRIFSLHFDSNLSHIRSLSFDEWLYVSTLLIQPYLFMYKTNDLKPEMEIQKYFWTADWAPGGLKTQRE